MVTSAGVTNNLFEEGFNQVKFRFELVKKALVCAKKAKSSSLLTQSQRFWEKVGTTDEKDGWIDVCSFA